MKKLVKTSLIVLASLGLVGCFDSSNASSTPSNGSASSSNSKVTDVSKPSNSTTPSTTTSPTPEQENFDFEVQGTLKVGETINFMASLNDSPLLPDELAKVVFTCTPAESMTITGRSAVLNKAGSVQVKAVYGTHTAEKTFTIEEGATFKTVKQVRALAEKDKYEPVYVRGVITATSGTSAYLQDATGGIFIYNFYFQSTDTACQGYKWQLGTTVDIYAYVTSYYDNPQLTYSYKKADNTYQDLEGRFANLSETQMAVPQPTEIDEAGLKALTAEDTGKSYSFTAEYVSGSIETTKKSTLKFKVGETSINMITDGSSSKIYEKEISKIKNEFDALGLKAGDKVDITAPLSSKGSGKDAYFSYYGFGTTIERHIERDTLVIDYDGEAKVGETLTMTASYNGTAPEGVVYTATKGADLVTITGNQVKLNAVGEVTIKGTYSDNGQEKTAETSFTIASKDPVKINTLKADDAAIVKGKVTATNKQAFVLSDDTGSVYVFMKSAPTVKVGDKVQVEGTLGDSYHGMLQFSTPTVTTVTEDLGFTVDETAIALTKEIADGFVRTENNIADNKKYKWTTTVGKSGTYFTLNFVDSETVIEPACYGGTLVEGNTYDVEAYFIGYDTTYKYATMVITDAKEKAPTEVSVSLNKTAETVTVGGTITLTATVKLPEGKTDNTVTWTSSDDTIATVENGVVTGVKAGTATIKATSNVDTTKFAEATITVKEASTTDGDTLTITPTDFTEIDSAKLDQTVKGVKFVSDINMTVVTGDNGTVRVFKGATLTISCDTKMLKKIEFTCTASNDTKYGPGCFTCGRDGEYTFNGQKGTWEYTAGVSSVSFKATSYQVRITEIVIDLA